MKKEKKQNNTLAEALLNHSALDLYKDILEVCTVSDLFSLSRQEDDYRLAFRSAWTLEHILLHDKILLEKHKQEVVDLFISSTNESSLRSISKLVLLLLKNQSFPFSTQESIIEKSFFLLEKEHCPVALLVNTWDILYSLSSTHSWITNELKLHIEIALEKKETPASKSRGKRIINKMMNS